MKLNRLILSTDDSHFKEFSDIVATAWRKIFPEVKLTLAYVSETGRDQRKLETIFDEVIWFKSIPNIPNANLSKIARRYACTIYGNEICMIEDIDTAPLHKQYLETIISQRKENTLGLIGYEVYENTAHRGKVPSSYTFAESYIWKEAINPENLDFETWAKSFMGMRMFDEKEDVCNLPPKEFSDESLMRAILQKNNYSNLTLIPRNCNPHVDWIDRSWWNIDEKKLESNGYLLVNFMRPLDRHAAAPVINHIYNRMKF